MDKDKINKILQLQTQVNKLHKDIVQISKNASIIYTEEIYKDIIDVINTKLSEIKRIICEVEAILNQSM